MGKPIVMGRKTWESIGRALARTAEYRGHRERFTAGAGL